MDPFAGGFVKEIDSGLHEDIITFDANSLYPNTIITLNLSPETKVGKVINFDETKGEVEVKLVNNKTHILSRKNFAEFLNKEQLSLSSAKILFSQKLRELFRLM